MSHDSHRPGTDFIRAIIDADLASGKHQRIATRFPPEPNGYLHIGHAKAICVDFGIARDYHGTCNLRFDDTNPSKEDPEYARSIERDIHWLGFDWNGEVRHASDYFEEMYAIAVNLIEVGKAYVCSLSEEDIRSYRGTLREPGRPSPYRDRSVSENLDLFARMRAGEFSDGAHVLRARIDMAAANMKLRDPLLYRIRHVPHDRTGDAWCIYPMYDYAHPLSDAFEGITHSICTLEFENNRPLYDWVIESCDVAARPQQIEMARLRLGYTVMSKRKLLRLVEDGHVEGWDDPRMPTLAAMRRRGYTPESIRAFCDLVGVAKNNSTVDIGKLEYAVRDDLNRRAPRVMCVTRPLRVVLTNFPEGEREELDAPSFPPDVDREGSRVVPLTREIFIDADDFAEVPPPKYHRLAPGRWVRLRYAYCIRCDEVVKDPATGEVVELRCTYAPESRGGKSPDGAKVWGVLHWVSASESLPCEVRLYDRLFTIENPDGAEVFTDYLNPESLEIVGGARVEPSVAADPPGSRYQFERQGYFCSDPQSSRPGALVFNRIVSLRDSWAEREAPAEIEIARSARAETRPQKKSRAEIRAALRAADPVLADRFARYQGELGLAEGDADVLTGGRGLGDLFEAVVAERDDAGGVAKWLLNELPRDGDEPRSDVACSPAAIAELLAMIDAGRISATAGKEVFADMIASGRAPGVVVVERGLEQVSDDAALAPFIDEVLAANEAKVGEYRGGKTGLLGFFVGQVMKRSGGKANPSLVKELVLARLS